MIKNIREQIVRADEQEKREKARKQKQEEAKQKEIAAIEAVIVSIGLDKVFMQALQNQNPEYTDLNGEIKRGIILMSGYYNGHNALLCLEPVNTTVNLYFKGQERQHKFDKHWYITKDGIVPAGHNESLTYYLSSKFLKESSANSLKKKFGRKKRLFKRNSK